VEFVYQQRIDRNRPTCVLFLLDQSLSMSMRVRSPKESPRTAFEVLRWTGRSKAAALADAINGLLYELVLRCMKNVNEGPRNYFDVGVVGYGTGTGSAFGGELTGRDLVDIASLANAPVRLEDRQERTGDQTLMHKYPIWIEPSASGSTPMNAALRMAHQLLADWVEEHQASFPPVVINITDGDSTDGDPRPAADQVRQLSTMDGNVLLFNLNLSGRRGQTQFFPSRRDDLRGPYAKTLFDMSSPLPAYMAELAQARGLTVENDARGFVFNADIVSVITFLQIGTSPAANLMDA
jgi:hypothetical protein